VAMTLDQLAPGVVVDVPKTADRTRPGIAYLIEVAAVYPGTDPDWARVGGHVRRRDGQPTTRRFPYRDADVHLPSIRPATITEETRP
jgi:hypothetical protein